MGPEVTAEVGFAIEGLFTYATIHHFFSDFLYISDLHSFIGKVEALSLHPGIDLQTLLVCARTTAPADNIQFRWLRLWHDIPCYEGGQVGAQKLYDAGEEVREASDVDCTEMCWYLADGRCLSSKGIV